MKRCFQLAKLGNSYVAPNPMVGAVLVYNDEIIGEGYHERFGEAHAEVNCIQSVKEEHKNLINQSTLYVSLEPCSHFGKTPPCADLIIQYKIPKVVISVTDNFHLVKGNGIQRLKDNGVEVITGILEKEGKELIRHFLYFHQNQKPYITLKFAQTKDEFIGIQDKEVAVSNELSKKYVHQLRASHQGILVGKNTVLNDNPDLTVRLCEGKNPIRIILGNEYNFPKDYNIFNAEAETIFLSTAENNKHYSLDNILIELYKRNIISVLVEGGTNTLQQFIDANMWNEAHIITAEHEMSALVNNKNSKRIKAPVINGTLTESITLQDNIIQILKNPNALSYS
jgi:diaminohydroxyphosphoribosylaminopyrimidine deaminase/5-amino-6-(5-phosphoribosylamino)uracil reductase